MMGMLMLAGAMKPTETFAAACGSGVKLLGMDPWYAGLTCDGNGDISQDNFKKENLSGTVVTIIATVVKDLMFLGGLLAVVLVMYGGFLMVTSQGNPSGVEKAKKTISGAIVGLIIALLAYAIATTVLKLTTNTNTDDDANGLVMNTSIAMIDKRK